MNGFSYMCNRWIYSFALLCAYILVCMMPRLIKLERKEIRFIGVALTIYFVVCMCVKYSRNGKLISAVAIGVILLIGLSIKNINEYNRCMMVTVAVMLAALANGIWKNASFGENYAAANAVYVLGITVRIGMTGCIIFGLISGIFIGTFLISLAETVKALPIFVHRAKAGTGLGFIVAATAAGKALGQLVYYLYMY